MIGIESFSFIFVRRIRAFSQVRHTGKETSWHINMQMTAKDINLSRKHEKHSESRGALSSIQLPVERSWVAGHEEKDLCLLGASWGSLWEPSHGIQCSSLVYQAKIERRNSSCYKKKPREESREPLYNSLSSTPISRQARKLCRLIMWQMDK